ncbi:MAG: hypothetical protein NTW86_01060, partial [Candidatus Sumerlaeota bacterium]|nr:hypothetical protein [Candidatus Sumerlaeota bacterium]
SFWPWETSGYIPLNQTGAYFAWISSLYADWQWYPCPNPWVGIVYSGTPHTPQEVWVEDRGSLNVRLHWRPDVYGSWFQQIVVFQVTSVDPFAGDFISVDGPCGQGLWQFIDYGGVVFDHAKASFFEGWADFALPSPGAYWFFIQSAGWLPPYNPPTTGPFATAFVEAGP